MGQIFPDFFLRHLRMVVGRFYTVTDDLLKAAFIQLAGADLRREGVIAVQQVFSDIAGHYRTVQTSGDIEADGHIRHQSSGYGFFQQLPEPFHIICFPEILFLRTVDHIPVFHIPGFLIRQKLQHMSALQRMNPFKKSHRRDDAGIVHQLVHRLQIQPALYSGILQDRLDLGGEHDPAVHCRIKQRCNTDVIPDQQKLPVPVIVQGNGELTVQPPGKVRTALFVQMEDHFHIGLRTEDMPFDQQFVFQLLVIEDLSVADHGDGPVLILNRLHAPLKVQEAQTVESKPDPLQHQRPAPVRSPVADLLQHPLQHRGRDASVAFLIIDSTYPTHNSFS